MLHLSHIVCFRVDSIVQSVTAAAQIPIISQNTQAHRFRHRQGHVTHFFEQRNKILKGEKKKRYCNYLNKKPLYCQHNVLPIVAFFVKQQFLNHQLKQLIRGELLVSTVTHTVSLAQGVPDPKQAPIKLHGNTSSSQVTLPGSA